MRRIVADRERDGLRFEFVRLARRWRVIDTDMVQTGTRQLHLSVAAFGV